MAKRIVEIARTPTGHARNRTPGRGITLGSSPFGLCVIVIIGVRVSFTAGKFHSDPDYRDYRHSDPANPITLPCGFDFNLKLEITELVRRPASLASLYPGNIRFHDIYLEYQSEPIERDRPTFAVQGLSRPLRKI